MEEGKEEEVLVAVAQANIVLLYTNEGCNEGADL